jgi:hypothetical protein
LEIDNPYRVNKLNFIIVLFLLSRIAVETLANEEKRQLEALRRAQEDEAKAELKRAAFVDELSTAEALLGYFGVPPNLVPKLDQRQFNNPLEKFTDLFGPSVGKLFYA